MKSVDFGAEKKITVKIDNCEKNEKKKKTKKMLQANDE